MTRRGKAATEDEGWTIAVARNSLAAAGKIRRSLRRMLCASDGAKRMECVRPAAFDDGARAKSGSKLHALHTLRAARSRICRAASVSPRRSKVLPGFAQAATILRDSSTDGHGFSDLSVFIRVHPWLKSCRHRGRPGRDGFHCRLGRIGLHCRARNESKRCLRRGGEIHRAAVSLPKPDVGAGGAHEHLPLVSAF